MPSYGAGALKRCFTGKLQATVVQSSRHERYEFFDDVGNLVASTVLSRSWKSGTSVSAKMVSTIQREFKRQGQSRVFDELVRCPGTREDWLRLVGGAAQE